MDAADEAVDVVWANILSRHAVQVQFLSEAFGRLGRVAVLDVVLRSGRPNCGGDDLALVYHKTARLLLGDRRAVLG